MNYEADSVDEYIKALPDKRREAVQKLREVVSSNLPEGFEEQFHYDMISYVVPLSLYPQGYHVKEGEPLPFISIASQKNHIALYHMGIYSKKDVEEWFAKEYKKRVPTKLDMGKSCIRFRNPDKIPYDLIGELCTKITVEDHIKFYEEGRK